MGGATQRKPAAPDVAKLASKAARRASARKQSLALADVLPLLVILLLLGLSGVGYVLYDRGYLAKLMPSRPKASRPTYEQAVKPSGALKEDPAVEAVRRALKDESVGLQETPLVADGEVDNFKEVAVPLIYQFLFTKYDLFASSKLTFRDMKEFLSRQMGLPYEQMRTDEYSAVIEDAVDAVTNQCRAGKTPRDECAAKIGFVPKEE
jgi:hypothetical protein